MLSEDQDNSGDSVPPLRQRLTELSQHVQHICCPAICPSRVLVSARRYGSFAARPLQEASA